MSGVSPIVVHYFADPAALGQAFATGVLAEGPEGYAVVEALEATASVEELHDLVDLVAAYKEAMVFGNRRQMHDLGRVIDSEIRTQRARFAKIQLQLGQPSPNKPSFYSSRDNWMQAVRQTLVPLPQVHVEGGEARHLGKTLRETSKKVIKAAGLEKNAAGSRRPLRAREIRWFKGVLANHLELAKLLMSTPWSIEQQFELLRKIKGDRKEALWALERAMKDLNKSSWGWEEKYALLISIAEATEIRAAEIYRGLYYLIGDLNRWDFGRVLKLVSILGKTEKGPFVVVSLYFGSAVEALEKAGFNTDQQYAILYAIAQKAEGNAGIAYMRLPYITNAIQAANFSRPEGYAYLMSVFKKAKKDMYMAFIFIGVVNDVPQPSQEASQNLARLSRLLDVLTDYNRYLIFKLFFKDSSLGDWISVQAAFPYLGSYWSRHFELYVTLVERWPRLGLAVLDGVLEAERRGIIPEGLDPDVQASVLTFVEKTSGFIPAIYQAYLQEGDSILKRIRAYAEKILSDALSLEETEEIVTQNEAYGGIEFLLGVIQTASPTSGASFVKREYQVGLLKAMLGAGDLRGHIPEVWRDKLKEFQLKRGVWRPRKGEVVDSEGQIKDLLDQFRVGELRKLKEADLVRILEAYLKSNRTEADKKKLQSVLYAYAGSQDALREKIDRIQEIDYVTLELLDQLFRDKDNLVVLLREALGKVPVELLREKGPRVLAASPMLKPAGVALQLKLMWADKSISEQRRLAILSKILRHYREAEVREKILTREDVGSALASAIAQVLEEAPALSKQEVIDEILLPPLQMIETEKDKFEYQEGEPMRIGLRVVKGPAFGLFGLTAGVCTADDLELWKNPNFKLMAIIDLDSKEAVGYIQMFEAIDDQGNRILTLPGINPSSEFMAEVETEALYDGLIEKIIAFAQEGDFAAVTIPVDPIIHSNRSGIQKVIAGKPYRQREIPEVHWNTIPKPYPFKKVFVVWER